MSKEVSSVRFIGGNPSRSSQSEANENEYGALTSEVHFPTPRTPLNTIPDPSQRQREFRELDFNSKNNFGAAPEARVCEKNSEPSDEIQVILSKGIGNGGLSFGTPRASGRGKVQSEPNSGHSTPARPVSRPSTVSVPGNYPGARPPHITGGKGGSSSRVSRRISIVNSEPLVEAPHFELTENPLFWKDHNVQVLLRIRPLSSIEKELQGYGQCLRQETEQSLVWLGHPETRFTFDHIAGSSISQENLFTVAGLPMVENCMLGYNSCMFAYGQTGSGKTYTMMGDIGQMEGRLHEDCGLTPRIFEYLFTRIREEEENRRNERLKFSCKCSFLEIYNEQITDLLEPSSTNLQLREDLKKGVYVENLTEYNVYNVNDVLRLLFQGAANRKIAATRMNSESSRSHSVFTCTIESHWEKDSMTHFRFGRLNLVDLAGSERQKSSGAEGDRLKEAANINKSLSTLGLVIMSLVDLAHGKHRHVPYRDSRLTFLLQDSLGGNSKTTIIANVSPSICSANETLSTLKFAQRAKLIQNNAKVNEDASGDVTALQQQIEQLKGQLSFLMKHHNVLKSPAHCEPTVEQSRVSNFPEAYDSSEENIHDDHSIKRGARRKMNCFQVALHGALRRECVAEFHVRRLKAEIEQLDHLVHQREKDTENIKTQLKIREERIKHSESLVDGLVSADKYLIAENKALGEEICLLQARIDKNPELAQFKLENMRLLERLRMFQDFYEEGEREALLAEVSELRDEILHSLEVEGRQNKLSLRSEEQDHESTKELHGCMATNSKLLREIGESQLEPGQQMDCSQCAVDFGEVSLDCDSRDEMIPYSHTEDEALRDEVDQNMGKSLSLLSSGIRKELLVVSSSMQGMELKQGHPIEEVDFVQEETNRLMQLLGIQDRVEKQTLVKFGDSGGLKSVLEDQKPIILKATEDILTTSSHTKLSIVPKVPDETQFLNVQYPKDHASHLSHQINSVPEEVEMETTKSILNFQERLCYIVEENTRLRRALATKEDEIKTMCMEWEKATLELTSFLIDGSKAVQDASGQIEDIVCSFPHANVWIGEYVERAAKTFLEKEETILLLHKSMEDAQQSVMQMELKLNSLKDATIALAQVQQQETEARAEEAVHLTSLSNGKIGTINFLEGKLSCTEDRIADKDCTKALFLLGRGPSDKPKDGSKYNVNEDILPSTSAPGIENPSHPSVSEDVQNHIELARLGLLETEQAMNSACFDLKKYLLFLQNDANAAVFLCKDTVEDFQKDIHEMRKHSLEFKENYRNTQISAVGSPSAFKVNKNPNENQQQIMHQIRAELSEINNRLNSLRSCVNIFIHSNGNPVAAEGLTDGWTTESSTSSSSVSIESDGADSGSEEFSLKHCYECTGKKTDLEFEEGVVSSADNQEAEKLERLIKESTHRETTPMKIRKEFKIAFNAFTRLNVQLDSCLNEKAIENFSQEDVSSPGLESLDQSITVEKSNDAQTSELIKWDAAAESQNKERVIFDGKLSYASQFFSKFEDAHATIKEADFMLNALLKANKNAELLAGIWKVGGKNLLVEKANLIEEIKQLQSSILLREGEDEKLQHQMHYGLREITHSISSLENSFLHVQKDVENLCKAVYSDALKMVQDTFQFVCDSRISVEDTFREIIENDNASFMQHQCHAGEYCCLFRGCNLHSFYPSKLYGNLKAENDTSVDAVNSEGEENQIVVATRSKENVWVPAADKLMNENKKLRKELERKDILLKGLLFDFSLLQESASFTKDIKDETGKLIQALSRVQHDLQMKTSQLDMMLAQHRNLEVRLSETEDALLTSNSDLGQAKEELGCLSDNNAELRMLLKDLYFQKSEIEEQLNEQKELVKNLEEEILRMAPFTLKQSVSSMKDIEDELGRVSTERIQILEQVVTLQEKLDMASAFADEKEAIALEARQESEASKLYAEQKEEEVKILENSVEELECTINVLEKKVSEMEDGVERHRLITESLELEIQALRHRLSLVENFSGDKTSDNLNMELIDGDQLSRKLHTRSLELHEAHKQLRALEETRIEQDREIKQCKEYISELVLHAEAQTMQYQQKYKTLEAMIREVKTDSSNLTSAPTILVKTEKHFSRTRGSSSPFRCISSLVQQMNLEKHQELSTARVRIDELEELVATQQKEVCVLNTRLAAAESMTHDVIRDLLGVKVDMTNYANLIEQHQLQMLVDEAQQKTKESIAMEQEIFSLRMQINDLTEERDRCNLEVNRRGADLFTVQLIAEQLQERLQLLNSENELLKVDKTNLLRKVAQLDDILKKLIRTQEIQPRIYGQMSSLLRPVVTADVNKKLAHSEKLLSLVNDELAQYHKSNCSSSHDKLNGHRIETRRQVFSSESAFEKH